MSGYRGFVREFSRTGSLGSLVLQLRTGVAHVVRRWLGGEETDPVARFYENYGPDGVRPPDLARRRLDAQAQNCLTCGLCSIACARVGGTPPRDPRDAVLAAARLWADWQRLELAPGPGDPCSGCDACSQVCPAEIPIHLVQQQLPGQEAPPGRDATSLRIG